MRLLAIPVTRFTEKCCWPWESVSHINLSRIFIWCESFSCHYPSCTTYWWPCKGFFRSAGGLPDKVAGCNAIALESPQSQPHKEAGTWDHPYSNSLLVRDGRYLQHQFNTIPITFNVVLNYFWYDSEFFCNQFQLELNHEVVSLHVRFKVTGTMSSTVTKVKITLLYVPICN